MAKIRPPSSIYGGKYYMCEHVIDEINKIPHKIYAEPFGGMASVLLNKPTSPIEIYNDLNNEVSNLFKVLREKPEELYKKLVLTPYSEREFDSAINMAGEECEIEFARLTLVKYKMSFSSAGKNFQYGINRTRRKMPEMVSAWLSSIDDNLPLVIQRLREVQIHCRDAEWIINKYDSEDTLFYCDPPYPLETRQTPSVYKYEMSDGQHVDFVRMISSIKGKAIVSSYDNELYSRYLADIGWEKIYIPQPNRITGKNNRMEVLYVNR